MLKNILIIILSVATLTAGILLIIKDKNKEENPARPVILEESNNLPDALREGEEVAESPVVQLSQKSEEEVRAEELKKIWMEKYQIGASHPEDYDPATFLAVDEYYAKDKNNVYFVEISSSGNGVSFQTTYKINIIAGADPKTFQSVKYPYSKDGKFAYYYAKKISGSDPETFSSLMFSYAKDKNYAYYEGKKMSGADATSFIWLNGYYAKDKSKVYYQAEIIKKADLATFTTVNAREAYDRNYNYYDGVIKDKR